MCMSVNRKYMSEVFLVCIAIPLSFVLLPDELMNYFFDCICSSHGLCTSGGGQTAFPFQDHVHSMSS